MSEVTGTDPMNEATEHGDRGSTLPGQITGIDLKVGGKDSHGNSVTQIYHYEPNKYVIYENDRMDVLIDGDDSKLSGATRTNELLSEIADYTSHAPLLKRKYNSSVAHALRLLLDGDSAACEKSLENVLASIPLDLARGSKLSYVMGAVGLMLLLLGLFGITFKLGLLNSLGVRVYTSLVFAAMGGVMSVAIGMRKLDVDLHDSQLVNGFYGALRVTIASIAGVVMLFLIESGFALAFLKTSQDPAYGFTIAAFLSGFSEMLVPNIMKKMDDPSTNDRPHG